MLFFIKFKRDNYLLLPQCILQSTKLLVHSYSFFYCINSDLLFGEHNKLLLRSSTIKTAQIYQKLISLQENSTIRNTS